MSFPVNGILDNFNRSNGGLGTNWSGPSFGDANNLTIISNAITSAAAAFGAQLWNPSKVGSDFEVYCTVPTLPASGKTIRVIAFTALTGAVGTGYYLVLTASTGSWQFARGSDGSNIGAAISQAFSASDSFGFYIQSGTAHIMYKSGAGAWTEIATRTATIDGTNAVYIGIEAEDNTVRVDDFGGGNIITVSVNPLTLTPSIVSSTRISSKLPSVLAGSFALQPPASLVTFFPSVLGITALLTTPSPTVTNFAAALNAALTLQTSTRLAIVLPSALNAFFTQPGVTLSGSVSKTIVVSVLSMTASMGAPVPQVTMLPNAQALTASLQSTTQKNTIQPNVLTMAMALNTVTPEARSIIGNMTLASLLGGVTPKSTVLPSALPLTALLNSPVLALTFNKTVVVNCLSMVFSLELASLVAQGRMNKKIGKHLVKQSVTAHRGHGAIARVNKTNVISKHNIHRNTVNVLS